MLRRIAWVAGIPAVALIGAVLLAGQAQAATIWTGDAAKGGFPFGNNNCKRPGSITVVTDPTHGKVWKYNKPRNDDRCESHGIKVGTKKYQFANNNTYYLGWWQNLSSTVDTNASFQWKSYGHHVQNFPVVLKMRQGRFTMLQRQPKGQTFYPWSVPLKAGTWHHIVLGIHTSSVLKGGWVELYFDGVQQTFSDGSKRWACRTWDSYNDPKWGVYGAERTAVFNLVDDLRVGTTYADVA